MEVIELPDFKSSAKKLHSNQKADLNKAIDAIKNNPYIGKRTWKNWRKKV